MNTLAKKPQDLIFERLAEGLDSTSALTRTVLQELQESEADFAVIKTELSNLRENVKALSIIVREGNGAMSLMTKIALIEQKLELIDKWIDQHIDYHQKSKAEIITFTDQLKKEFDELESRFDKFENAFVQYKEKIDLAEKIAKEKEQAEKDAYRASVNREQELAHVTKKHAAEIKKEKQSFYFKALGLIIALIIGAIGTWITKFITDNPSPPTLEQKK